MPEKLLDVLQNLLVEHQNKAYLSCDETCFCWSVQELIASVAEDSAQQNGGEASVIKIGYLTPEEAQAVKLDNKPPANS